MVRARSARTLLAETKNRFWNVPAHWDPSYKRSHTRFNAYTASTGWEVLLIKQYSSDLSVAMTKLEERWDGLEKYWKSNAFDKNRETMREHMKQQTNEIWRRKLQQQHIFVHLFYLPEKSGARKGLSSATPPKSRSSKLDAQWQSISASVRSSVSSRSSNSGRSRSSPMTTITYM